MTENELRRRYPNASKAFIKANSEIDSVSPGSISEHDIRKALHDVGKNEARSSERCLLSFTCYRTKRQDPDNAVVKWFVDALRRARLIQDDTEDDIEIKIKQVKCKTRKEERTEIELSII